MEKTIDTQLQRDQSVWDRCSAAYERRIVGGHPDVHAYEAFEETLIDHLLLHLARNAKNRISLVDLGCGSGRLIVRLAAQTTGPHHLKPPAEKLLSDARNLHPEWAWNPLLHNKLRFITGVDFSRSMVDLARKKFESVGLVQDLFSARVSIVYGSAFDPVPQLPGVLPVVVCLINSIGVMQGMEGAQRLFRVIRDTVETNGGIGLISCFCRENIRSHGLGQYESTMDVSGPPIWLKSDRYDLKELLFVPLAYRRYDESEQAIDVAVYEPNGKLIDPRHTLQRIPECVEEVVHTGEIFTHQGYESHWYSKKEIKDWIGGFWGEKGWQMFGSEIDPLRARATQLAWYDPTGMARQWMNTLLGEKADA